VEWTDPELQIQVRRARVHVTMTCVDGSIIIKSAQACIRLRAQRPGHVADASNGGLKRANQRRCCATPGLQERPAGWPCTAQVPALTPFLHATGTTTTWALRLRSSTSLHTCPTQKNYMLWCKTPKHQQALAVLQRVLRLRFSGALHHSMKISHRILNIMVRQANRQLAKGFSTWPSASC